MKDMIRRSKIRLANELMRFGHGAAARRFQQALHDPRGAQSAILARLLHANRESRYGQVHRFDQIRDARGFQDAVPVVDYDGLAASIEAIKRGETGVLTSEHVLMLEKSGGSTAASKYIPYTESLRREFQQATSTWLHDLVTMRPKLRGLGTYWSVSPIAREREVTEGGLRVGFEDDTEYFGALERWVLQQLILVPGDVRRIDRMDVNRYVTLRHLLNSDDLGLISVWNPSFLTLLVQEVERQGDRLVRDLRAGTLTPPHPLPRELQAALSAGLRQRAALADRLETILRRGDRVLGKDLWPKLQLISCWTSAIASRFVPELQARFPGVEIQGKGLLATEGVVSFPLLDRPGAVLALDSHFLEFVPEGAEHERPRLAHELDVGARYSVLLTTGGGLYRYALHDLVEVVGRVAEAPLVKFVGKSGKVSDVVGEKLNELRVGEVLEEAIARLALPCRFAMLAPEWGTPPHYALFIESSGLDSDHLERLTTHVEALLRQSHHYAYARDLGQLGPLQGILVTGDAQALYLEACERMGQKCGNIKPTYLHNAFGWTERFGALQESR